MGQRWNISVAARAPELGNCSGLSSTERDGERTKSAQREQYHRADREDERNDQKAQCEGELSHSVTAAATGRMPLMARESMSRDTRLAGLTGTGVPKEAESERQR